MLALREAIRIADHAAAAFRNVAQLDIEDLPAGLAATAMQQNGQPPVEAIAVGNLFHRSPYLRSELALRLNSQK
ncbi:hypothetical protein NSU_0012 [Novosphingobium pentaromativorans US6-1]|uniref:Uncharacterized protein n=1 Tax=Novosphingobium pentaromativorans US6-1 TaxID=1088721 RepID=G6E6P2_9SPHN|nr:hypothetical protein NSU_0012 [Novosphingobium pentaromativorans US6-1]